VRGNLTEESLNKLDDRYIAMTPPANINTAIEDAIGDKLEEQVHGLDPDQFYMTFEDFSDTHHSVKTDLEESIKELLIQKFQVSPGLTVSLKLKEDKLSEKAAALTKKTHLFSLDFKPLSGHGQPIPFDVRFEIVGVLKNGFGVFQKNLSKTAQEEIAEIQAVLSENLLNILASIPFESLISTDFKTKELLETTLNVKAFQKTSEQFGLKIRKVTFKRQETIVETQTRELEEHRIIHQIGTQKATTEKLNIYNQERLIKLIADRNEEFDAGNIKAVIRLDKEIEQVKNGLSTELPTDKANKELYLGAGNTQTFSWEALINSPKPNQNLPEGDSNNAEQTA
jgi:hypothetical protein